MAMSTSPTQATSSAAAWTRQRAHHPSGSRDLLAWARGPRRAIAWGVEAPAPTVRGWPGSCATTTRWSWRSTGPTAPPAGGAARPTPRRRGRRPRGAGRPGDRPAPRPAPGGSRCSAGCGARASAMKHAPGDQRHQGAAGHRPHDLRQQLRDLPVSQLVRTAARLRPGAITTRPRQPNWRCAPGLPPPGLPPPGLSAQIKDLDSELDRLTAKAAARLVALLGWAPKRRRPAGGRRRQPWPAALGAAVAMLCGSSPIQAPRARPSVTASTVAATTRPTPRCTASCGCGCAMTRHPGRHGQAHHAGKSKREVIGCLKRYVAREVFAALCQISLDKPAAA